MAPEPKQSSGWSRLRARIRPFVPALIYTLVTLLVYWRVWTPIDGAQGSWRFDPRFEYWQDLIYQARTLGNGQLALWNPYDRGGFPLYGDPQPGMLYPGNWPIVLWGVIAGSVPYSAIGCKILAHWVFGALGMHLLLRRFGVAEPGCYAGGLLFSFTSPKLRYGGSALNWSVSWLPWLILAVDWFADRPSWRRGVVVGSVFSMVLLSGAPAVLIYALLLTLPFAAWRMWGRIRSSWRPIAVAAGTCALWLLPLVASNLEQLPESVRQSRNLAFIGDSVFSASHFGSFAIPGLGGENPYVGLAALLAAAMVLTSSARNRALIFTAVAATALLLAMGRHAGFLPAAASALPPFSLFRRAHRYLYVVSFALAVLAGLGIGKLIALEAEERRARLARVVTWIGGLAAFALGMSYLIFIATHDKLGTPKGHGLGQATLSALVSTWLLRSLLLAPPGRRRAIFAWAIPVVLGCDIWLANYRTIDTGMVPHPVTERDRLLSRLQDVDKNYRVYDRGNLNFRPGTRLAIRDFGGYEDDPLGLSRYKILSDAIKQDSSLMGHANIRYFLEGDRQPRLRAPPGATSLGDGIFELGQVAPPVYYVPAPERADGPAAALRALRRMPPGDGGVVEADLPAPGPTGSSATGRITTLEPNRVVAKIETPGPGLVVIGEAYFPAWEATVNGKSAAIHPANVLFRGVFVDAAGAHTIEMELSPMRFWALLPLYALAWGVLFAALFWRRREPVIDPA